MIAYLLIRANRFLVEIATIEILPKAVNGNQALHCHCSDILLEPFNGKK